MFKKRDIFDRFASCYTFDALDELAQIIGVTPQMVDNWKVCRRPIPCRYLKNIVDEHNLSWDWLIEGKEPKKRSRAKNEIILPLDQLAINRRFLSLYPPLSQAKLGELFGVGQTTVYKWHHAIRPVPWERLKTAVDEKGATWEWLLEGRK